MLGRCAAAQGLGDHTMGGGEGGGRLTRNTEAYIQYVYININTMHVFII